MRTVRQQYEIVPIGQVQPHPANPRQGDRGAVYTSIEENGFYGAIVVQRSTGFILAGNHRYLAALDAGAAELPVLFVDVDDDRARRILLVDNRTGDLASYDEAGLAELLQAIATETGTLAGTGYDGDDLDQLLRDLAAPPPDPAPADDAGGGGEEVVCPQCGHHFQP